ncbi:MAG: biopolymer transporter ExbD [Syntrophorhabdales bacterium]|jgi:biopolymer transport protein ExbD
MRLPRTSRKKPRIEIIPMIDTMFFLLVFFMVATLSMTAQRGLTVNLPHAATARDEIKQVVTLTVTKEGKLFFDKEEVASPAEAALRLASQTGADAQVSVVINADRAVEHGRVVDLMDAVRQAGVTRIAIAVRPLSP